ncbi:MAG: leucine-rich repeat domain-containing protein [Prevotella sp.]|nr:leucine-rich repeat domain-containing protein [Prevotella sp.]
MTANHVCGQNFTRSFFTPPVQEGAGDSLEVIVSFAVTDEETRTVAITGYEGVFSLLQLPGVIVEDSVEYTVISIESGAFASGDNPEWELSTGACLVLPATLEYLGIQAFAECEWLEKVDLGQTTVTDIGEETFLGCKSLTEIELPAALTSIGSGAFYGCEALESIVLPDSMQRVGDSAFENCTALTSFDMGTGLVELGDDVFSGCIALEDVTWSNALTIMGARVFKKCKNLKVASLPEGLEILENAVFEECTALADVSLPDGMRSIGEEAFKKCVALESLTIPDHVELIGAYAFADCTELLDVILPQLLSVIDEGAFYNCRSLSFIVCPENVSIIGNMAFKGCENLIEFVFPKKLTFIGYEAFYGCSFLEKVTLPATVEEIGEGAFSRCGSLARINVEQGNENYCSKEGVLFTKDMTTLVCYPVARGRVSYNIPRQVKTIGLRAFECNATLSHIEVGPNVELVEEYAFAQCEMLSDVQFLGANTVLGEGGFSECKALESIMLPAHLELLPDKVFYNCESITDINLPATVNVIGERAMEGCVLLEELVLPPALEEIGEHAFFYCEGLQKVVAHPMTPPTVFKGMEDDEEGVEPVEPVGLEDDTEVGNARAFSNYDVPLWLHGFCFEDYLTVVEWSSFKDIHVITEIYAADVDVYPYGTQTLNLAFQRDDNLVFDSIAFVLKLPDGYSLVEEEGEVAYTLAEAQQESGVTMEVSKRDDNAYLFSIRAGEQLSQVMANGDLLKLTLKSDTLMVEERRLKADITEARTMEAMETMPIEATTFDIHQEKLLEGDFNFDRQRSVMDVMMMIDFILQNKPWPIPKSMADWNGDRLVNVVDVLLLVQMILHANTMQEPF